MQRHSSTVRVSGIEVDSVHLCDCRSPCDAVRITDSLVRIRNDVCCSPDCKTLTRANHDAESRGVSHGERVNIMSQIMVLQQEQSAKNRNLNLLRRRFRNMTKAAADLEAASSRDPSPRTRRTSRGHSMLLQGSTQIIISPQIARSASPSLIIALSRYSKKEHKSEFGPG